MPPCKVTMAFGGESVTSGVGGAGGRFVVHSESLPVTPHQILNPNQLQTVSWLSAVPWVRCPFRWSTKAQGDG